MSGNNFKLLSVNPSGNCLIDGPGNTLPFIFFFVNFRTFDKWAGIISVESGIPKASGLRKKFPEKSTPLRIPAIAQHKNTRP